jgi:putative transposase
VDVLGYCLMPNHFHLLIHPQSTATWADGCSGCSWPTPDAITAITVPAGTLGKGDSFIIQDDDHRRTVLRYVERNPLRAELVAWAEDWKWSISVAKSLTGAWPRRRIAAGARPCGP